MPQARIEIEAGEGCIDAFTARPAGKGRWPPILLLSDSRGLRPAIETMARHLANFGYVVLAPDLFHRDTGQERDAALAAVLDPDNQAEDFEAWLHSLENEPSVDDRRMGVVGYGVGAACALHLAAAHAERVAAAAIFYGGRPEAKLAQHLAGCINAVLHLGYAQDDHGDHTASLEEALRRAGVDFEVETYPAGRGFAVPDHPGHDIAGAERHWKRLSDLFNRTLRPLSDQPPSREGVACSANSP